MKVRKLKWRYYKKRGGPPSIGNRCKTFAQGCIVCNAYMFKIINGRFPNLDALMNKQIPHNDDLFDLSWDEAIAKVDKSQYQE